MEPAEPHYYLSLFGTDPACAGRGYGQRLLAHNLAAIDTEGAAAYLDCADGLVPLYTRFGFSVTGSFFLPDGPRSNGMWRPPVAGCADRGVHRTVRRLRVTWKHLGCVRSGAVGWVVTPSPRIRNEGHLGFESLSAQGPKAAREGGLRTAKERIRRLRRHGQLLDDFVGRQDRRGEEAEVDLCRIGRCATGASGPVTDDVHVEPVLGGVAQVGLHAQVRGHPGEDDRLDVALAQLDREIAAPEARQRLVRRTTR